MSSKLVEYTKRASQELASEKSKTASTLHFPKEVPGVPSAAELDPLLVHMRKQASVDERGDMAFPSERVVDNSQSKELLFSYFQHREGVRPKYLEKEHPSVSNVIKTLTGK